MAGDVITPLAWGQTMSWPQALAGDRRIRLAAGSQALDTLARELGLDALLSLEAVLRLRPWLDGVEVDGEIKGVAIRQCSLSLEPFENTTLEALHLRLLPLGSPNAAPPAEGEVTIELEDEDPPEEVGADIDLTAYVVEAFALGLDPFPRKPGAVFTPPQDEAGSSPFAVLAKLGRTPPQD
jgi:hypothetical protein